MNADLPRHIAIIMDGNGRWARERGLPRTAGHREGLESVRAVIEAAAEAGVSYLSLYAFSTENWNRPQEEIKALFGMMVEAIGKEIPTFVKNGIRVVFAGDRSRFTAPLLKSIEYAVKATSSGNRLTVIVCLSYSGRWDLQQAAARYAADVGRGLAADGAVPGEEAFARYLTTADYPDPDLLIRTSGEQRISNFMLWQLAYTELYFTPVFWPDFRKEHFLTALDDFARRSRRFGKTAEQFKP